MINRRSLITGLISLVAAPAIVRVQSIMPVRSMIIPVQWAADFVAGMMIGEWNAGFFVKGTEYALGDSFSIMGAEFAVTSVETIDNGWQHVLGKTL